MTLNFLSNKIGLLAFAAKVERGSKNNFIPKFIQGYKYIFTPRVRRMSGAKDDLVFSFEQRWKNSCHNHLLDY